MPSVERPGPEPPQSEQRISAAEIKLILFGVVAILAGVFIGQNVTQVDIHFIFFTAHVRLIWVFLLCMVIGAVLDRLLQRRGVLPMTRIRRVKARKPPEGG
jgi:uncharacterized integral membrane protein